MRVIRTDPVNLSCPPRIPTVMSLSSGDPKCTNCSSLLSRNSLLVVSSNRFVMWSSASRVPYLDAFNFSAMPKMTCEDRYLSSYIPSKNSRARLLTNTDPAKTPGDSHDLPPQDHETPHTVWRGDFLDYQRSSPTDGI